MHSFQEEIYVINVATKGMNKFYYFLYIDCTIQIVPMSYNIEDITDSVQF